MPRVYEVARELGLTSREVIARLEQMGTHVSTHSSSIDDATVSRLRAAVDPGAAAPARGGNAVAEETSAPARPVPVAPRPAGETAHRAPSGARRRSVLRHLAELPLLILVAFAIAVVMKTFLIQAFFIPSGSMLPTLEVGDRVLVEKLTYRLRSPRAGDVVVFARDVFGPSPDLPWTQDLRDLLRELLGLPTGRKEDYIKRIVAVGGDTVRYAGKPRRLIVNGERVEERYVNRRDRTSATLTRADCRRLDMDVAGRGCRVPAGKVFVMGDNRANSEDSRVIGPIEEEKIVGHAFVVIWPPTHLGGL